MDENLQLIFDLVGGLIVQLARQGVIDPTAIRNVVAKSMNGAAIRENMVMVEAIARIEERACNCHSPTPSAVKSHGDGNER